MLDGFDRETDHHFEMARTVCGHLPVPLRHCGLLRGMQKPLVCTAAIVLQIWLWVKIG